MWILCGQSCDQKHCTQLTLDNDDANDDNDTAQLIKLSGPLAKSARNLEVDEKKSGMSEVKAEQSEPKLPSPDVGTK